MQKNLQDIFFLGIISLMIWEVYSMRKIIASLDIGTNTIKLIVGEFIKNAAQL